MPLLLRGLNLPDPEIRADVIQTFLSAIGSESKDSSVISEYASTLVTSMLKNSMASEIPSTVGDVLYSPKLYAYSILSAFGLLHYNI